jgi:hypothetical protein
METLRTFSEIHIDEDCQDLTGNHENGLFFNCKFSNVRGLTLKNCDLNKSKFLTDSVKDALDFTVTLNCHSFRDVELSPLMFDLMLSLLTMTTGNDEKRKQLLDVIGQGRAAALLRVLGGME